MDSQIQQALGNGGDYAAALAVDASGHAYVTGSSYGGSGTRYDYATIMYDVNGNEQWVARYNGSINRDDYAAAIDIDVAGNVYVTGRVIEPGEIKLLTMQR